MKGDYFVCLGVREVPTFARLDRALIDRRIRSWFAPLTGGRIYRVHGADVGKLPEDAEGRERYVGDEEFGYRIFQQTWEDEPEDTQTRWTPIYEETTDGA